MILEFSVANFRSIYTKQAFTTYASSARSKADNIFDLQMSNGNSVSLIKSAVIYGANASGKSNIIYALRELQKMITQADRIKIDGEISSYKPFLFNALSINAPCDFEIIFVAKNKEKYRYYISFNEDEIIKEELFYFPKKREREIFTRLNKSNADDINIHIGKLGSEFNHKQYKIYKKLPLLFLFGNASDYRV